MNLRAHIRECIAKVQKAGVRVRSGTWSVRYEFGTETWVPIDNQCCPLGAILIVTGDRHTGNRSAFPADRHRPGEAAAQVLHVHRHWVGAFCEGNGGVGGPSTYAGFDMAWEIGRFISREIEGGSK